MAEVPTNSLNSSSSRFNNLRKRFRGCGRRMLSQVGCSPCFRRVSTRNADDEMQTGQKTVTEQMELVFKKWDPLSRESLFHTYLYNSVDENQAPFFRPGPEDNEAKWEEALRKRPDSKAIPILCKGFHDLGQRIVRQNEVLLLLRGRLHEINNGLSDLLRRHDLQISARATECRKRHLRISQKTLALAAKVQVLSNRGYAMDSAEEELRKKLLLLERSVFDPALDGRSEEIWARMVSVRERGRQLQREFEKAGRDLEKEKGGGIDEEVMKRAKKVCYFPTHGKAWLLTVP